MAAISRDNEMYAPAPGALGLSVSSLSTLWRAPFFFSRALSRKPCAALSRLLFPVLWRLLTMCPLFFWPHSRTPTLLTARANVTWPTITRCRAIGRHKKSKKRPHQEPARRHGETKNKQRGLNISLGLRPLRALMSKGIFSLVKSEPDGHLKTRVPKSA